jgi:Ca2+-binding EF-hand superfamily protein
VQRISSRTGTRELYLSSPLLKGLIVKIFTNLLTVISSLVLSTTIAYAEEQQTKLTIQEQKHLAMADDLFKSSDANHDGFITKSEFYYYFTQHNTKSFKELDVNKDGRLTPEELKSAWY